MALVEALQRDYADAARGVQVTVQDDVVQMVSHPDCTDLVAGYLKEEVGGELRGAALETLAVIVYRGPIARHEIEHIRGVNCTQSLRNLLLRGLIDERPSEHKNDKAYVASMQLVNHLGVQSISLLPNYEQLHTIDVTVPLAEAGSGV